MMMRPKIKVSVIIPTYNMGKYIRRCINSILCQTLSELEVIIIDDGSTDETKRVVSSISDSRIRYYYQDNQGTGKARNKGIEKAIGESLMFIDPDDEYASEEVLEKLYYGLKSNDVKICGGNIIRKFSDGRIFYGYKAGDLTENKVNEVVSVDNYKGLYGHTRFLYDAKMIKEYKVRYAPYVRYEDQVFLMKALGVSKRFYEMDLDVYIYHIIEKDTLYNDSVCWDVFRGYRDTLKIIIDYHLRKIFDNNIKDIIYDIKYRMLKNEFCRTEKYFAILSEICNLINESGFEVDDDFQKEKLIDYVNYRINEKNKLIDTLQMWEKVIIYGAGNISREFLKRYNTYLENVIGIAVSEKQKNDDQIENILVRSIDDYLEEKDKSIVVLMVSEKFVDDICETLTEKGFTNKYIPCVNYIFW